MPASIWHRFSLPVLALGARDLYTVVIEGFGFTLPVSFHPTPICGFYLSVNVAAVSVRAAQNAALALAERAWARKGFASLSSSTPQLRIDHIRGSPKKFPLMVGQRVRVPSRPDPATRTRRGLTPACSGLATLAADARR